MNAIEVRNVSKKFTHYPSQRDRLFDMATGGHAKRGIDFWALKDINFEVPQGTTFGIIGQNGSGKSTLLSILVGVLQPTSGTFVVNGKVAAILELGSGFHQEFTGRENVYMYAAILGLSRPEINRRLDEIVDFSELHEFIDRPLHTYSSGMVVRLAFATVVNVDADILIIDEALSVGDALFQHRCFRKIKQMKEEGKTILYVGHDTEAVRNICNAALLLDKGGSIRCDTDVNKVVNFYVAIIKKREQIYRELTLKNRKESDHNKFSIHEQNQLVNKSIRFGTRDVEILSIDMLDKERVSTNHFISGAEDVRIQIVMKSNKDIESGLNVGFVIRNKYGDIYGMNTYWLKADIGERKCNDVFTVDFIQTMNLGSGTYTVSPVVAYKYYENDEIAMDWCNDRFTFTIQADNFFIGYANLQSRVVIDPISAQSIP